jgi:hypothetical protein
MDVVCTLSGPTGDVDLSYGAAIADEAIEFTPAEDKNTLTVGGDGSPMNSLHAAQHGTITVRVLKTSPANALLMAMYDAQSLSSSLWGQNVIIARQTAAGDVNTGSSVAFKKKPAIKYNKVGDLMEWTFDAGKMTSVLGTY